MKGFHDTLPTNALPTNTSPTTSPHEADYTADGNRDDTAQPSEFIGRTPKHPDHGCPCAGACSQEGILWSAPGTGGDSRDEVCGAADPACVAALSCDAGPHPTPQTPRITLTPRQTATLRLLANGLTCKEVARVLHISPKTASLHAAAARTRLGARNTAHAVAIAIRGGLILVLLCSNLGLDSGALYRPHRARGGGTQIRMHTTGRVAGRAWWVYS